MPLSRKREPKVVLDANIWVYALLWGGKSAVVIKTAEEGKIYIVVSEGIVGEISQVLTYPKLLKVHQVKSLHHGAN